MVLCVQERDGLFMLAFAHPAEAVSWAVLLQLALLRYLILVRLHGATFILQVKLREGPGAKEFLNSVAGLQTKRTIVVYPACLACRLLLPLLAGGGRHHAGPHCNRLMCRLDWSEDVLTLPPTAERFNPVDGSLLFRGLSAKAGIFEGEMSKITPHTTSGKAQYSQPV